MVNLIALFAAAVAVLDVVLFFAVPAADTALHLVGFHPQDLLTFAFAHFDSYHLIENILGLVMTAALAIELEVSPKTFMLAFFAGILVAVPMLLPFPTATIAGSSTAIFGALAATLAKAHGFIPVKYSYLLVVLFIVGMSVMNSASCDTCALGMMRSEVFHLAGFAAGATVTFTYKRWQS